MKWQCEGCKKMFADYINGCPHCWDSELSVEENHKKFPNRKVIRVEKLYSDDEQGVEDFLDDVIGEI